MRISTSWTTFTFLAVTAATLAVPIRAAEPDRRASDPPPAAAATGDVVFTATLSQAVEVGMAKSLPPVRMFVLEFTDTKSIRGKVLPQVKGSYQVRSMHPPRFPVGSTCRVTARKVGNEFQVVDLTPGPVLPQCEHETERKMIERLLDEDRRSRLGGLPK